MLTIKNSDTDHLAACPLGGNHNGAVMRSAHQGVHIPRSTPCREEQRTQTPTFDYDFGALAVSVAVVCARHTAAATATRTPQQHTECGGRRQNNVKATPRDQVDDGGTFTHGSPTLTRQLRYRRSGTADLHAGGHLLMRRVIGRSRDLLAGRRSSRSRQKRVVTFQKSTRRQPGNGAPITWEDFHWRGAPATAPVNVPDLVCQRLGDHREGQARQDDREVVVTFKGPLR